MSEAVNPRPSLRAEQAAVTRRRIADAARLLFVRDGYGATTLQAIADEAGVAVQTVYAVYRSKPGILRELRDSIVFLPDAEERYREAMASARSRRPGCRARRVRTVDPDPLGCRGRRLPGQPRGGLDRHRAACGGEQAVRATTRRPTRPGRCLPTGPAARSGGRRRDSRARRSDAARRVRRTGPRAGLVTRCLRGLARALAPPIAAGRIGTDPAHLERDQRPRSGAVTSSRRQHRAPAIAEVEESKHLRPPALAIAGGCYGAPDRCWTRANSLRPADRGPR